MKKKARRLLERLRLYKESFQDATRYFRSASWAGPTEPHCVAHLEAELTKHYHVVEKGLAMPEFRAEFGEGVVRRLGELVLAWEREGRSKTNRTYLISLQVLQSYVRKHEELGLDVTDRVPGCLLERSPSGPGVVGGTKAPGVRLEAGDPEAFDRVARSRHSVRSFCQDRVPEDEVIAEAVEVATCAPSVCNRQTWRVHVYRGEKAQEVLTHQNGNRGFGHQTPVVLVVTSDMRYFAEVGERFQPWIEGGIFSMLLMLALHSRGIANVALNWSQKNAADVAMRDTGSIPDHERIIMVIGCGYPTEDALVTHSCRHGIDRYVTWHG
jgi:nitroreductase